MSVIETDSLVNTLPPKEDLFLRFDWPRGLDQQVVVNSQQDHIVKYEPDDTDVIFNSISSVREWRRYRFDHDNPVRLWLGTAANQLAGIAWIENAHREKESRLAGVRIYEGFEKQGYGTMLSEMVHEMYDKLTPPKETRFVMRPSNNAAFIIGAVKLGYKLSDSNGNSDLLKSGRRTRGGTQLYTRGRNSWG
jgi:hypothetical protein